MQDFAKKNSVLTIKDLGGGVTVWNHEFCAAQESVKKVWASDCDLCNRTIIQNKQQVHLWTFWSGLVKAQT